MSVNQPSTPTNPLFSTPNPDELQSQESQSAVRERLITQQGEEADVNRTSAKESADSNVDDSTVDNTINHGSDSDRILENRLDETGLGLSSPPPPD